MLSARRLVDICTVCLANPVRTNVIRHGSGSLFQKNTTYEIEFKELN